jgi:hypothetical protein
MGVRDDKDMGKLEVVCYVFEMMTARTENMRAFCKRGGDVAGSLGGCLVTVSDNAKMIAFNNVFLPKCVRTAHSPPHQV